MARGQNVYWPLTPFWCLPPWGHLVSSNSILKPSSYQSLRNHKHPYSVLNTFLRDFPQFSSFQDLNLASSRPSSYSNFCKIYQGVNPFINASRKQPLKQKVAFPKHEGLLFEGGKICLQVISQLKTLTQSKQLSKNETQTPVIFSFQACAFLVKNGCSNSGSQNNMYKWPKLVLINKVFCLEVTLSSSHQLHNKINESNALG